MSKPTIEAMAAEMAKGMIRTMTAGMIPAMTVVMARWQG